MKLNQYYAACIAAYVVWGFISFPLRALADFPSTQILYFRVVIAAAVMLVASVLFRKKHFRETLRLYREQPLKQQRQFLGLTLLGGIFLAINWLSFIYVMNHIDVQSASFAYLICPILTAVLAYFLLQEHLRPLQWAAIGLSLLSCLLIGTDSLLNLLYSLIIALSYAFYLLTQRVLRQYDKLVLLSLQLLLVLVLLGPFYPFLVGGGPVAMDGRFFGLIAVISVVFTILPLFLNLYALKELRSSTIGILMYLNPIINFGIAFWWFQEQTSPQKLVAYGLIFVSVVLYNLRFAARPTAKPMIG